MRKTEFILAIAIAFLSFAVPLASADELKFGFVNPSFGGNPFNSAHLLGTAQAQNTHKEEVNLNFDRFNSDLQETLSRPEIRIVGDTLVQTATAKDGSTVIDIVDLTTSEVTQVVIP